MNVVTSVSKYPMYEQERIYLYGTFQYSNLWIEYPYGTKSLPTPEDPWGNAPAPRYLELYDIHYADGSISFVLPKEISRGLHNLVFGTNSGWANASDYRYAVEIGPLVVDSVVPTPNGNSTDLVITGKGLSNITSYVLNGVETMIVATSNATTTIGATYNWNHTILTISNVKGLGGTLILKQTDYLNATPLPEVVYTWGSPVLFTPVITSFTPVQGVAGMDIIVDGYNLISPDFNSVVCKINGAISPIKYTPQYPTTTNQIKFRIPHSTTGKVSITNQHGTATSATDFTYLPPTITSFSPTTGTAGTVVTVYGTNFSNGVYNGVNTNPVVKFNGIDAGIASNITPTSFTITAPVSSTGKISLTEPSGSAISSADFVYQSTPITISKNLIPIGGGTITQVQYSKNGGAWTNFSTSTISAVSTDLISYKAKFQKQTGDAGVYGEISVTNVTPFPSNNSAAASSSTYVIVTLSNIISSSNYIVDFDCESE